MKGAGSVFRYSGRLRPLNTKGASAFLMSCAHQAYGTCNALAALKCFLDFASDLSYYIDTQI